MTGRLAVILSAGAAGLARLLADDEPATLRSLAEHRGLIAGCVRRHGGRVVDELGDGLLAEFSSALDAAACGARIQREIEGRIALVPSERRLRWRIGIDLGDVTTQGDAVYGAAVNGAARLEGLAEPGGVWVSGAVYERVRGRLDPLIGRLGERCVENAPEALRAYRLTPGGPLVESAAAEPAGGQPAAALATPPLPKVRRVLAAVALLLLAAAALAVAWIVIGG